MSYESRIIVVDRSEFERADTNFVCAFEVFRFDLCAMGSDTVNRKLFYDIFDTEIDFDLLWREHEVDTDEDPDGYKKDYYGEWCKYTTLDNVIEWLSKAKITKEYRRAKSLLAILRAFKRNEADYDQICVVHFGY